ncbi:uncharacterized protein LOC119074838 isoform X2 [Bradysia coprophila]|uniref:uncharacterized protein LOC119074838 isoform X2 n=1 Tax=Bradysia coprophila TaxID=38358 RepID=UPI00187DAABF|nr:uncharacterized protein LOC119074838 isoform X2 [Bradysia coprophila]
MSRRSMTTRIDRVAQMSMQEEIIAKRKLELLEKQKTAELAKQVQAAQTGGKSSKKEKESKTAHTQKVSAVLDEPPPPKNNFNNDGSFFENFKKITDAAKKAQEAANAAAQLEKQKTADSANISDSIIAELIQAPPPPPPLPEQALPPPPALPVLLFDNADQKFESNESDALIDKDKRGDNRSGNSLKSESNASETGKFTSQSSTHDSNRREPKYSGNQEHRPKTTSRFSNPPTTKIPSLLDLPSENPFGTSNEMPSNRSTDSFFHNDDMSTSTVRTGPSRFSASQPNRFDNEQVPQSNKFSTDGINSSKDSFGYRFGDNRNNYDQPSNRFADEQSFSNQFGGNTSGRDNFGGDSQDRFASNSGPNFAKNPNRFAQDQLSSSTNKYPSNSSPFNRFGPGQEPRSNSNSQESFTFEPSTDLTSNKNPFPQDQDDRILPTTHPKRFTPEATKNFANPFAQNAPNKGKIDDAANSFPAKDIKVEADGGRQSLNDNQRFLQNQTPNQFMLTTPPPPNNQRNLFPNQSMNRFGNPDAFGRTTRFDDFPNNSFNRPAFNMPPMSQSMNQPMNQLMNQPMNQSMSQPMNQSMNQPMNQQTNFIPNQPNLQQPPPNFPPSNPTSTMVSPFNNTAFGMNFTTPPPANPLLHSIPQPLPMSLNKIPPPKELDLNAIPEPQLNLMTSNYASGTVFSDNDFIPTSIDALVALVAENDDDYEDKLCSRNIEMHPSLWFLSEKNSLAYRNYRQKVLELRNKLKNTENDKYDPLEIDYKDDDIDDAPTFDVKRSQSDDYDSDSEYMQDTKARNLNNMKRKLDSNSRDFYSSDSEDHERFHQRFKELDEKPFKAEKDSESDVHPNKSNRKSRWGEKVDVVATTSAPQPLMSLSLATIPAVGSSIPTSFGNQQKPMLTSIKRTDQALLNYARQNYGTVDLSEEDWKKCEDHFKVNLLYQDMLKKRQEIDRMARSGRFKYEYDSDEDIDGGTWEHKLRNSEMEATSRWAEALNEQAEGKHHIGDFLPPEELKKFMEKYDSKLNNREPDISDYKEYKLKEDNIGFQMLQKLGWKQGEGLRPDGIVDPVNKAQQRDSNQGLGAIQPSEMQSGDNEYDAYRKRMMLAYRFRPNPLNNPRRAYY